MTTIINGRTDCRRVINRKHRMGDEQPANIILLPTQSHEVNDSAYDHTTYDAPLTDEDVQKCMDLGIHFDRPPESQTETGTLADGAAGEQDPLLTGSSHVPANDVDTRSEEDRLADAAASRMVAEGSPVVPPNSSVEAHIAVVRSVSPETFAAMQLAQPPVDNDHVADGAERFVDATSPVHPAPFEAGGSPAALNPETIEVRLI